jgi:hypothetical protein
MTIDQFTPLLPMDIKEVNAQVKHLKAILDTAIIVDPTLECENGTLTTTRVRASTLTPPEGHS